MASHKDLSKNNTQLDLQEELKKEKKKYMEAAGLNEEDY